MSRNSSVRYMDKSRAYYAAHGYETAYKWAHFTDTPFVPPPKPLADCTLTVVTTAMPDASFRAPNRRLVIGDFSAPPAAFYTGDLAWDTVATHTDDRESYFPLRELERAVASGALGGLARHYYCVPTAYSSRQTIAQDAPNIVASCIADAVDVALLIPL